MESFYYVVLYAGLLWLPHKTAKNQKSLMADFFGQCFMGEDDTVTGGALKLQDIASNGELFVRKFEWEDEDFETWI